MVIHYNFKYDNITIYYNDYLIHVQLKCIYFLGDNPHQQSLRELEPRFQTCRGAHKPVTVVGCGMHPERQRHV